MKITPQNLQDGLPFAEALHYRKGRKEKVRVLVIHTAETPENSKMAESIQSYCQRRSDTVSCHEAVDNDSVVCGVRPFDTAWTTGSINNFSYSYELSGRASQTKEQWADEFSTAMIAIVAKRVAKAALCWNIPIRKLTPAELKAGASGICGHVDQTVAYEVKGGHTDPGPNFPWEKFLNQVRAELALLTGEVAPIVVEPVAPVVPVAPVAAKPVKPALKRGASGPAVKELQQILQTKKLYMSGIDGYFGPVTEQAVRRFQTSAKIVIDGNVGPQTWKALLS
jgi:N-acetyl-anhydromuramyl-L-alanine amidase AmpD